MYSLEDLFSRENYKKLILDIARGKTPVNEYGEWIEHVDRKTLERAMMTIENILWKNHREMIYPLELIVVPRYPFSKTPLISWSILQDRDSTDPEVVRIKDKTGKLGNLINAGFILKHFVLIDIDLERNVESSIRGELEKVTDVRTKRGYHIIRYLPRYEACLFESDNVKGEKIVIKTDYGQLELLSGKSYLGSYPPQARYLDFSNGKVNVHRYREISNIAKIAFSSADLTTLESTPRDVEETINTVLGLLGIKKSIKVHPLEKQESERTSTVDPTDSKSGSKTTSRFNVRPLPILGRLRYSELKSVLEKYKDRLPTCLRQALFGRIERGHRYFHLRFLVAILPFFISLDEENLNEFIKDFSIRTDSKRSDVRKWYYDVKYFTGRITVEEKELTIASRLGIPAETWSDFETLGYCNTCNFKDFCLSRSSKERRKLIVSTVADILESAG